MNYHTLKINREQFLSLTSLYPEEFEKLLSPFSSAWYEFYTYFTLEGKRRLKSNWHPEKDTPTLPGVEDKLLFLLTYFKLHPLQQFQAASFGLSQPKVSLWVKILIPVLESSFKNLKCLPCREGSALAGFLKDHGKCEAIHQDVVEQTTPRPVDDDAQAAQYSGKKKQHTYKNKVDCLDNQSVVFLSPTFLGAVHDKKIADEQYCQYPEGIRLFQDLGFQGYEPDNVFIVMPFKKPRKGILSEMQKWFNRYVAQRRIVVEHAIMGIKRCHIIQRPCRLTGYWIRDQIMNLCTALHNFRVKSPLRAYQSNQKFQLPCACASARGF